MSIRTLRRDIIKPAFGSSRIVIIQFTCSLVNNAGYIKGNTIKHDGAPFYYARDLFKDKARK